MQKIKEIIANEIAGEISKINPACELKKDDVLKMFEYPPDSSLGDIALPCFKLSKILRNAPAKIADAIAANLSSEAIGKVQSVNGYLNIFINNDFITIIMKEFISIWSSIKN
jgi:arginyl-tRNA synthetase